LLGIKEYGQAFFKPCHIIYQVIGERVVVYVIANGRRDMHTFSKLRIQEPLQVRIGTTGVVVIVAQERPPARPAETVEDQ
jgi:hypothetical protein